MSMKEFKEQLEKIGICYNEHQLSQLEQYYNLLIEWNEKINLTAITEKEQVYLKHFYDSLTLAKIIDLNQEESLCDIGTGAGFPGIVLKIFFPKLQITLVDSLQKRVNFLNLVIKELHLEKITALHVRAEEYAREIREQYDVVTARAVSHMSTILEYGIPLVKVKKNMVLMKGNIGEELEESKNALNKLKCKINNIIEFDLPDEAGHRTLILVEKQEKTSSLFPRKYSEIKKKRL